MVRLLQDVESLPPAGVALLLVVLLLLEVVVVADLAAQGFGSGSLFSRPSWGFGPVVPPEDRNHTCTTQNLD